VGVVILSNMRNGIFPLFKKGTPKACYGGKINTTWASLIWKKAKQQKVRLKEVSDSESGGYDSESDADPEDVDTSDIP
jgi:hypothetical protein